MRVIVPVVVFLGLVQAASAQVGVADQQCIWSCLHGPDGGAEGSAAHTQCVQQRCTAEVGTLPPGPGLSDAGRAWRYGRSGNGTGYATIDAPGRAEGARVIFFCKRGGEMFLQLDGIGQSALHGQNLIIVIDGKTYPLGFRADGDTRALAALSSDAAVIAAMQSGSHLVVRNPAGETLFDLPLRGAREAVATVIAGC
ncbi:hypothetical protein [Puniceibacterium confluentis]|nr:hypothetical protein [Puniceibacterium confluentis]